MGGTANLCGPGCHGTRNWMGFSFCSMLFLCTNEKTASWDLQPTAEAFVVVSPILICLLGMNVKSTDALKAWIMGSVFDWHTVGPKLSLEVVMKQASYLVKESQEPELIFFCFLSYMVFCWRYPKSFPLTCLFCIFLLFSVSRFPTVWHGSLI